MILDRTWNKRDKKLSISYITKEGKRDFITKYLSYIPSYEYDPDGEYDTWDGQKAKRVNKKTSEYNPNTFDILEYIYNNKEEFAPLFENNYPNLYTFDIETEVSDEFPDPEVADQRVTAISVVGHNLSCIVYGLHRLSPESIGLLKERYISWIRDNKFAMSIVEQSGQRVEDYIKVYYKAFSSEEELLEEFFNKVVPNTPVLAGWNSYRFDWMYLTTRIKRLFGATTAKNMIYNASPTKEVTKIAWKELDGTSYSLPAPQHSVVLDYMEICKQYDRILVPYESFSLDYVSSRAVDAHKIKYDGSLQQLYERDVEWYYYYNAVDSLLVQLIHRKLKSLEVPCSMSTSTMITLKDAFGQVAITNANMFYEFYDNNKVIVYNWDHTVREKKPYKGAFCECISGHYTWNVCYDFASLYPSQIQTCNLSFDNIVTDENGEKFDEEELEKFRKDPNYFVTVNGNVYKNDKEYTFKKMQRRMKKQRDEFKYTGQRIDSELLTYIDSLIKLKNNK